MVDVRAFFALSGPPDIPDVLSPDRPTLHPEAFDLGLEQGTSDSDGTSHQTWLGHVCTKVAACFGGDTLGREWIVLRVWAGHRFVPVGHEAPHQTAQGWRHAGCLVHHAMKVRQVEQVVGDDGEPQWRLLSRDPIFVIEDQPLRAIRVRGLPPAEQSRRYALEKRREKLRLRLLQRGGF